MFRLTQKEYRLLQTACAHAGSRSLAEFTRSELLAAVQSDARENATRETLSEIERKLDELLQMTQNPSAAEPPTGAELEELALR